MRGETITIVRKGEQTSEDSQGNPIFEDLPDIPVAGCAFAPRSSEENGSNAGARIITGGTVYAPPGTVLFPTDLLRIRGQEWQIDGEVGDWVSPFSGDERGVEVAVKRGA